MASYLDDLRTKLAYLEESGPSNAGAAELIRQEIEAEEAASKPAAPKRTTRAADAPTTD